MTDEEKKLYRGAGRVAFLARLQEIKEMVDAGHPLRNVYRKHGDKLNISYGQFARYVNKFIRSKLNEAKLPEEGKAKPPIAASDEKPRFKPSGKRNDLV